MVERGGLRERVKSHPQPQPQSVVADEQTGGDAMDIGAQNGQANGQPGTVMHAPQAMPPTQVDGPSENGQQPSGTDQLMLRQDIQEPQQHQQQQQQQQTNLGMPDQGLEEMETLNEDNFQIEGMDLDMGDSKFEFDDMQTGQEQSYMQQSSVPQSTTATVPAPSAHQGMNTQNPPQTAPQGQDTSEFNNFDDFTAGDGLIDFEGGDGGDLGLDLSMDNSAFGDAFHENEGTGGEDGSGAVQ